MQSFTITNNVGDIVTIRALGAQVASWQTTVNQQSVEILAFANGGIDDVTGLTPGGIVGPYFGSINQGQVPINGKMVQLSQDSHGNHQHGGRFGLDKCTWQLKYISERAISASYWLENGFNGYPGAIEIKIEYRLAQDSSQLKVQMFAYSERHTPINLSQLCYFHSASDSAQITVNDNDVSIATEKLANQSNATCGQSVSLDSGKGYKVNVFSSYPSFNLYKNNNELAVAFNQGVDLLSSEKIRLTDPEHPFDEKIIYKVEK